MLFNSVSFFIFFIIVFLLYYAMGKKNGAFVLLVSSYYFYMSWKPAYVVLIIISTLVDYFSAICIEKSTNRFRKRVFLFFSLTSNIGLLFAFKYYDFFSYNIQELFRISGSSFSLPALDVILPIGISFYTFQTLSYTIDVFRGKRIAEKSLLHFSLYVSYFPQLVAGPIERSTALLPQLKRFNSFKQSNLIEGLELVLFGLFKKVVIADCLAVYVNAVYNNSAQHTGATLLLATYFFAFQIYCDFSGYSDIARGVAKTMGVDLIMNFNTPYFSKSISEFWKRWHISLSTWFRDYLYIPLGGNRVSLVRNCLNLMIVFIISGLWHGANWTFVIWGGMHGIFLIFENLVRKSNYYNHRIVKFIRDRKLLRVIILFHLVCISWVFFRSENLSVAIDIIRKIILMDGITIFHDVSLYYCFLSLPIFVVLDYIFQKVSIFSFLNRQHIFYRWAYSLGFIFYIILFGVDQGAQFIYFQF